MSILGSPLFWSAALTTAALVFACTLVGRAWAPLLPRVTGPAARFYLAPALGLGTYVLIASLLGRMLPLGDSPVVPLVFWGAVLLCVMREQSPASALRHATAMAGFALACGASMLAPLFAFGGFNAHNDVFTYLVHGDWLQHHAFTERLTAQTVTPLTTQISLYQHHGLRMGASFLLALAQAVLNAQWSFAIYPAVVIAAVTSGCAAIGFALWPSLRYVSRMLRLALLALPAFTLGGIVFGANLGFLPQTVGLALAAALLFMAGDVMRRAAISRYSSKRLALSALPAAMLLAAAIHAYSEFAPFLLIGLAGGGVFAAWRYRALRPPAIFVATVLVVGLVLLNVEVVRAVSALQTQARAIVGSPVDWSLWGFVAHAFGVHGGAWDIFQWASREPRGSALLGTALGGALIALLVLGRRGVLRLVAHGALAPAAVVLLALCLGLLYFRYAVPAPFEKGVGQSWSQFKLSDWAHPFVMAMVLGAGAHVAHAAPRAFNKVLIALFAAGLVVASWTGIERTRPLMLAYAGVADLGRFYTGLDAAISAACGRAGPVFLALNGEHHKVRQMALLFLPDRHVRSDWTDDGYIFVTLPEARRVDQPSAGDCIVEPNRPGGLLASGAQMGPLRVGLFRGEAPVRIAGIAGAYDRESDGGSWWHWVRDRLEVKLHPSVGAKATATRVRFQYGTRAPATLKVRLKTSKGDMREFVLKGDGRNFATFEQLVDLPPAELAEIIIESDAPATRLGANDPRLAGWMFRNLSITAP